MEGVPDEIRFTDVWVDSYPISTATTRHSNLFAKVLSGIEPSFCHVMVYGRTMTGNLLKLHLKDTPRGKVYLEKDEDKFQSKIQNPRCTHHSALDPCNPPTITKQELVNWRNNLSFKGMIKYYLGISEVSNCHSFADYIVARVTETRANASKRHINRFYNLRTPILGGIATQLLRSSRSFRHLSRRTRVSCNVGVLFSISLLELLSNCYQEQEVVKWDVLIQKAIRSLSAALIVAKNDRPVRKLLEQTLGKTFVPKILIGIAYLSSVYIVPRLLDRIMHFIDCRALCRQHLPHWLSNVPWNDVFLCVGAVLMPIKV